MIRGHSQKFASFAFYYNGTRINAPARLKAKLIKVKHAGRSGGDAADLRGFILC
jgi:hypothetical protein